MENIIKHWHAGTRIVSKGAYFQGNNVKIGENVIFCQLLKFDQKNAWIIKKILKQKWTCDILFSTYARYVVLTKQRIAYELSPKCMNSIRYGRKLNSFYNRLCICSKVARFLIFAKWFSYQKFGSLLIASEIQFFKLKTTVW